MLESLELEQWSARRIRILDRQHKLYYARTGWKGRRPRLYSFTEWFESPTRQEWRLGYWAEHVDRVSGATKALVKDMYGLRGPYWTYRVPPQTYSELDWVLSFRLRRNVPYDFTRMFVDHIVKIPRRDPAYHRDDPYGAIQVWPLGRYSAPPFRLDRQFKTAFLKATRAFGVERASELVESPNRFLSLVSGNFH